jgi:outer membrane receptor protein involved in Fe transport
MQHHAVAHGLALLASIAMSSVCCAAGVPATDVEQLIVTAARDRLIGETQSASQGTVVSEQLENRPTQRPGEVLEVVPGLIVTQHSGDGKANQYFLRGFNLDHGTDFATRVDGVPVNMPTHAHGQGYSDMNFLIPELVGQVEYKKGTYYAEEGNFSAAGAADVRYRRTLDAPLIATFVSGENGYERALIASSTQVGDNDLLVGVEYSNNDGPWDLKEGYRKQSGVAKFTRGDFDRGFGITAMGYDSQWHSTDQIPMRAYRDGSISRFGAIDLSDGGETSRYSLSADWWQPLGAGQVKANVFGIDYRLDLISNFTYATDAEHGDQFEQFDERRVYGSSASYSLPMALFDREGTFTAGLQTRYDDIKPVGLYRTQERTRYATVRQDEVRQTSYAAYISQEVHWTNWFRSNVGARFDYFSFDVDSNLVANAGSNHDSIASPKLALIFGPWQETEFFVNYGEGFHSNDARGTTISVDPNDGVTPVSEVDPLVRAVGAEIGLRSAIIPRVQFAATLWTLELDSELLFIGDGGTTEPSRGTRRTGVEIGAFYTPTSAIVIDADLAWSRARFSEFDPVGDRIPNAVERVASIGVAYNRPLGFFVGARLRYFGPAPLIEDNSVRSSSTMLVNLQAGYKFTPSLSLALSVFNVFDREDNDITYFYDSQLPGESEPVSDIHFHPVEPRTLRAAVTMRF